VIESNPACVAEKKTRATRVCGKCQYALAESASLLQDGQITSLHKPSQKGLRSVEPEALHFVPRNQFKRASYDLPSVSLGELGKDGGQVFQGFPASVFPGATAYPGTANGQAMSDPRREARDQGQDMIIFGFDDLRSPVHVTSRSISSPDGSAFPGENGSPKRRLC
jgi:hypothetical protein